MESYYNNTTILFTSNININKYIAKSIYIKLAHIIPYHELQHIILDYEFQSKLSMHQFQIIIWTHYHTFIYIHVTNMKHGISLNNSNIYKKIESKSTGLDYTYKKNYYK